MGADLRWERLNVVQPPSPTGRSPSAICSRDLPPASAQYGHAVRQLSARPGSAVLDRSAARRDPEPRALPGVLHPGRLAAVRPRDRQCRRALHAEFSLNRRERPGRRLQSARPSSSSIWAATASRAPLDSSTSSISARASASSDASPTRPSRGSATGWSGSRWRASRRRSRRRSFRSSRRCRSGRSTTSRRPSRWPADRASSRFR